MGEVVSLPAPGPVLSRSSKTALAHYRRKAHLARARAEKATAEADMWEALADELEAVGQEPAATNDQGSLL